MTSMGETPESRGGQAQWFDPWAARERSVRQRLRGRDAEWLHPLDRCASAKHQLIRDLVAAGMPEELGAAASDGIQEIIDYLSEEY